MTWHDRRVKVDDERIIGEWRRVELLRRTSVSDSQQHERSAALT